MSSNKKNPFLTYINCWKDKNKRFPTFLFTLFALGLLVAIVEFIIVVFFAQHPHVLNFSVFHQNYSDSFADFFNINSYTRYSSPYLNGSDSSYPPLNFLFALPFVWSREEKNLPFSRNSSWQTWASLLLLFAIFIAMTVILLILFYKKYKPNKSVLIFIILAHVLSSPVLFLVERANYLYFTFFFVGIFLLCYNSSKRYVQYLAFISLAIAVGMKMYPAVFALLLLKERRYKDLLITAGISIIAFFLPFCFFKGGPIENVKGFITNLTSFSSYERLSIDVSTNNTLRIIVYMFGGNYTSKTLSTISLILRIILLIIACTLALISKKTWHTITLASACGIILPSPAMIHALIFVIFGFIAWLNNKEKTKLDYVYAIFFFLILTPMQFGYIIHPSTVATLSSQSSNHLGLTVNTLLQGLSIIGLVIIILIENILKYSSKKTDKTN